MTTAAATETLSLAACSRCGALFRGRVGDEHGPITRPLDHWREHGGLPEVRG